MKAGTERLLLALDCSGPAGSVAVSRGGQVTTEIVLAIKGGLSAALMPAIDYAMRSAGAAPADLDGVVVGAGPGSFTGLRVAAATAKGIVHTLRIPLVAYSSLLATAAPLAANPGPVGVLFDARGRDVYAACYDLSGRSLHTLVAPAAMPLDQALALFSEQGTTLLTGDGASRHENEIAEVLRVPVVPAAFASPRAGGLLWLAETFPQEGAIPAAAGWEPDYLRASGAERIAKTRASAALSLEETG